MMSVRLDPSDTADRIAWLAILRAPGCGLTLVDLTHLIELQPDACILYTRLASLYATPTTTQSRVQIMTMHKAKGLEFDTVIIPGLHTGNNRNTKPLLAWWERPRQDNSTEVLIASLHAAGSEEDKLYQYIWTQQQKAMELETTRLLYVAVTRAKTYLHLVGVLKVNEETGEQMLPSSTSLFNKIWQSES